MSGSIKITGKSKGGLFMYSRTIVMIQRKIYSKKESARRLQKKRGDILDSVWEVEEQFIATVKDIIQNCVYFPVYGPQRTHGLNEELYCYVDDKDGRFIGYVEGGDFLLDSEFIYKQFQNRWRIWSQSQEDELSTNFPKLSKFYQKAYDEEWIIPYGLYFPRPLYRIIKNGISLQAKYFCISQEKAGVKPRYFLD